MDTKILMQPPEGNVNNRLDRLEALLLLNLMSSGGSLPVTSVATSFSGALINTTNRYLDLYANNYDRVLAMRIAGDFLIPGSTVKLSLQNTDNGKIDVLSSVAKVISDTIWLYPGQTLYINTADTAFDCTGSTFRVLLFDPLSGTRG